MSHVYKTQSLLSLSLETDIDLSGASVVRIKYVKPRGDTGYWPGTISGTTKITYEIQNGDIDEAGLWKFQSYIEVAGRKGYGEIVTQEFEKPI